MPHDDSTFRFRVVTYNIHKGIGGLDRRYRPQRLVEALESCQPDIVLMQEVDDGAPRSNSDFQAQMLAEALQMEHHAFQRNVTLRAGHYGNAILSRFPLTDVDHADLTIPLKKRRRGLLATCTLPCPEGPRALLIVNVHLGLAAFERKIQLRRLLQHNAVGQAAQQDPLIIAGDFNDVWGTLGRKMMAPAGFDAAGEAVRTFPAAAPLLALDRFFYRGDLHAEEGFAIRNPASRHASDHLPLVVDFQLLPASYRSLDREGTD
ncbi:endonuclease/exonuclease/phosphatase family protein [Lignipirellula cremea]|uniref:Endonuclease/exonuclease/phosphatase domain-containing protein n=1 Tax=Lignipirellula cremea TaxID=2528010 RepID=A0A518DVZ3_9BACT|nr:endonuclease/exonuclease/phosphatase family protein [Lignipirellula cremea]QDU96008.1 hypothetical protein Pla8534_38270 [Lignipirellula cremea]